MQTAVAEWLFYHSHCPLLASALLDHSPLSVNCEQCTLLILILVTVAAFAARRFLSAGSYESFQSAQEHQHVQRSSQFTIAIGSTTDE